MAEHLQAVRQQVEDFVWRSWSSDEKQALHKGLCKYGDEWDRVANEVGSKPKNEVVLAAIKLMLEEPDFLQHCGSELQPRLRKLIDEQRQQQQQDTLTQQLPQQQQQTPLQRYESCSVDQPVRQHQRQHSIDLQVAESTNLGSMQILEQQLEQWQQQLIRHEQHPLPPLPPQQQRLLGAKRLSDSPDPVLPDDVELFDQIRPTKRHQCNLPDATAAAAMAPSILAYQALQPQQQQQQTGVLGVPYGSSAVNLSPQAAAVLAAHQEILAVAAATQHNQAQQQQQQQILLAAAQQQQLLRQQHLIRQQQLLQSVAGAPRDAVMGSTAAEVAQAQLMQQQQQQQQLALMRLQQQQTAGLVPQALVPANLSPVLSASAALPGIPTAAAGSTQSALQMQQQLAAAAATAQFTAPTPLGSSLFGTTNNSSLFPGLLACYQAAAGTQRPTPADLASLACLPPNPAAAAAAAAAATAGLGTNGVMRLVTSQTPAALPLTAGVACGRPTFAPAPGSLAQGLAAAAAAPQITHQQQQQQQQRRVSGIDHANHGLVTPAANLDTLLGDAAAVAAAAVNPDTAAALATADVPRPVRTLPAVHDFMGPQQQQQQQELMGWQQRNIMTQLMQQPGTQTTALPATAAAVAEAGGHGQAGTAAVNLPALLTQQQQQQQGPQFPMPMYGIQQTLQKAVPPAALNAVDHAAVDPNTVLNLLGVLGSPTATTAATPRAAALAAAGGWNAAALAALTGGTAAGNSGLLPGSIADNPFKLSPLSPVLPNSGENINNTLCYGTMKDMNNISSPGLNMLGTSSPYLRFSHLHPTPEPSSLPIVDRVESLYPPPLNHLSNGVGFTDLARACDGVQYVNGVADSGTGSSESVDESSPLGSEGTPLTSESDELGEHDEHTAEGYESETSSES